MRGRGPIVGALKLREGLLTAGSGHLCCPDHSEGLVVEDPPGRYPASSLLRILHTVALGQPLVQRAALADILTSGILGWSWVMLCYVMSCYVMLCHVLSCHVINVT